MLGEDLFAIVMAGALVLLFGCASTKGASSGTPGATRADGGVSAKTASGGSHAGSGIGGGAAARAGGAGGSQSAAGAGVGGGSNAGASGGAGGGPMASAGAGHAGGASGNGGGAGGAGSGSDAGSTMPASCSSPSHILPLNPQNPQDGITLSGFYVDTDTWNAAKYQVSQTMYVCDYDNWYVVANMNDDAHDGAVKTYPNVHQDFGSAPKISSMSTISSSFAHNGPHVGIYEFAYDIWLNGVAGSGSTEVMIWTDNYHQVPSGSSLDTVTFDGQSYDVYKQGSYIAFVAKVNVTSGTLNLLAFFNYIIGKGWIPATSTLGAIDYGIELVSTGGMDAKFEVVGFTLTAR